MRLAPATVLVVLGLAVGAGCASLGAPFAQARVAGASGGSAVAVSALDATLRADMRRTGRFSGAEVVDLDTGRTLYSDEAAAPRLPASVEKLYTTATALSLYGSDGRLMTSLLSAGTVRGSTLMGPLYLHGGGDPTFGSAAFDHDHYGAGATIQALVARLRAGGITRIDGPIVADESWFDADRGTPATGNRPSGFVEGLLSGLSFDRGWANADGTVYFAHPALEAGMQLASALRAAGVRIPAGDPIRAGVTPAAARQLASVASPPMTELVGLTNAPSDNFFAEMLLKDIGARFGAGGTTAAGAAVVRKQIGARFGIHPRLNDGSGLSRYDRTSPAQVISLLTQTAADRPFTGSLAIAGRTGTLEDEMRGTYAQGRCRGKTGSLHDVSNVVGYCTARNGDTLAYALLMNGIVPDYAHPIQDRMQVAIAEFDGRR